MNSRAKGLSFCNEVKKILEGVGHEVDGPFFKAKWFNGKTNPVHCDLFDVFDLCSHFKGDYYFHQVSTLDNKATKIKALQAKDLPGWVWCRVSNGRVFYRIFIVKPNKDIEEAEIRWKA